MSKNGAFGIIFDEMKRVLLCHRCDCDAWNLPGGGIEDYESPWEAVKREVKEEVGLDVRFLRLAGIYEKPKRGINVDTFVCEVLGGKITTSDEADRIQYFSISEIPKNTFPKHIKRIEDSINNPETVVIREESNISSLVELGLVKT